MRGFNDEPDRERPHLVGARRPRWGWFVTFSLLFAVAAWVSGEYFASRILSDDLKAAARRQEPLPEFPKKEAIIEASDSAADIPRDLDGVAIAYDSAADGMVEEDGRFRIDLAADPDSLLFRVQRGVLTPEAKIVSRRQRKEQAARGQLPWLVSGQWTITRLEFTIKKVRNPSANEAEILKAISSAARGLPLKPGVGIRAVGVASTELDHGDIITVGMLPPEGTTALDH